jgi:hypothetical protein
MAQIFLSFDSYENWGMDRVSFDKDGTKNFGRKKLPKNPFLVGK